MLGRDLQEGPARDPEPGHAAAADRGPDRRREVVVDAGRREGRHLRGAARQERRRESRRGRGSTSRPENSSRPSWIACSPTADDTVCDPACGTGGFLLAAHDYVVEHQGKDLDKDQKKHLRTKFVKGWELVPNTARLCIMNLYLHGIDADPCPINSGVDSLASDPGERFSLVLTNPPFGKKSSIAIVNEEGDLEKEDTAYERQDFWTTTKNKQLNFLQHVKTLLKVNGRCAIVVPDNVLFEGGAGETVRRNLLKQCDVHTLLRLPTGIFYAQGVKANVLFFDAKPAQEKPWTEEAVGLRPADQHALHAEDEPAEAGRPGRVRGVLPPRATATSASRPGARRTPRAAGGRFDYDELMKRDKVNLDIFWLKDKSLEDSDDLPEPDVLAQEIADDLQTALEQFSAIANELKE